MDIKEKVDFLKDSFPEAMLMDGFDDCIIGTCCRFGMNDVVLYDKDKIINKMIKNGMSEEEALEFFSYNQLGAWVGEGTPVFAELF